MTRVATDGWFRIQ